MAVHRFKGARHGPATHPRRSTLSAVVELRQYTLHPGRRDELIELFEREFIEPQEACGIRVLGQFRDLDDPDRFVWMRGFRDMAARAGALPRSTAGPVWQRASRRRQRHHGRQRQRAAAAPRRRHQRPGAAARRPRSRSPSYLLRARRRRRLRSRLRRGAWRRPWPPPAARRSRASSPRQRRTTSRACRCAKASRPRQLRRLRRRRRPRARAVARSPPRPPSPRSRRACRPTWRRRLSACACSRLHYSGSDAASPAATSTTSTSCPAAGHRQPPPAHARRRLHDVGRVRRHERSTRAPRRHRQQRRERLPGARLLRHDRARVRPRDAADGPSTGSTVCRAAWRRPSSAASTATAASSLATMSTASGRCAWCSPGPAAAPTRALGASLFLRRRPLVGDQLDHGAQSIVRFSVSVICVPSMSWPCTTIWCAPGDSGLNMR